MTKRSGIRWVWNRNRTVGDLMLPNAMCVVWKSTGNMWYYRVTSDGERIAQGELDSVIDAMMLCVRIAANLNSDDMRRAA